MRNPRPAGQLTLGMFAHATNVVVISAPALLIPHLHLELGYSLVESGMFAAAPTLGTMVSLVAWGAVVDRTGERLAITSGLALVTITIVAAMLVESSLTGLAIAFAIAGIGAASSAAASGRLVVGWFPAHQRGLAMGIRQTAVPIGLGFAALTIPITAEAYGITTILGILAAATAAATVTSWLGIVDPPRGPRAAPGVRTHPYSGSWVLQRIHAASALLVVPQFLVWTFMLVWLIDDRGWATRNAALIVAFGHLLAVVGRIGAGAWSDRVGSRLVPMKQVSMAGAVSMVAVALADPTRFAVPLMLVAAMLVVSNNGLSFTSVAEIAGPHWAGRALGIQNTGQHVVSALVPPTFGWLITHASYPTAFVVAAVFAAVAVAVIPQHP